MELITLIQKISTKKEEFLLVEVVNKFEKNKHDKVYEGLQTLIFMKLIIPNYLDNQTQRKK